MNNCGCEENGGLPVMSLFPVFDNSTGAVVKTICSVNALVPAWINADGVIIPAAVTVDSDGKKTLRVILNRVKDLTNGAPPVSKVINYQFDLVEATLASTVTGFDNTTDIVFVAGLDGTEMPVSTTSKVTCHCYNQSWGWRCYCYTDILKETFIVDVK